MSRDECRLPGCTNPPGESDDDGYRTRMFCSPGCDVKYDHLKDDARDARLAAAEDY